MKKIILLVVALVLVSLVVSCVGGSSSPIPTPTPTTATTDGNEPPIDRTWISPGKVHVGNFYPGARAEWPLLVHNGNDYQSTFEIKYRQPDHVGEGYIHPTAEAQDWVIIADPTPVVAPYETREIMVVLDMPGNSESPGDRWEFWISVMDTTQTGKVQTELCSRWLVQMR